MEHQIAQVIGNLIGTTTQTETLVRYTNITSKLEEYFEFQTLGDPKLQTMLRETANFCAAMRDKKKPPFWWLSFVGNSGNGKTHLAKQIAKYFHRIARFYEHPETTATCVHSGQFYDWREVTSKLKEGGWGLLNQICEDWFCVIDDIGAEYDPSGAMAGALDRVLNSRKEKWTVLTSNLLMGDVQGLDVRIASRLLRGGNRVVNATAMDFCLR